MKLWREIQLKNLTTKITKGTTPTTMGFDFVPEGINFIKAESITRYGEIDEHTFAKIDSKTHEALRRSQIQEHDILVTIAGIYLGKIGLVQAHHIPANTNQAVAIVRADPTKVIPKYLKYFFLNKSTTTYLNMLCPQSAQPNLNLTQLGNVKLLLPDPKTQQKIAAILSAYDDLIENNKRRIAILEKMAEEIYREWFVRMRFPASAKATAGKPDTGSTKGIPVGWEVKRIGDLFTTASGGTPSRAVAENYGEEIPWIKTGELKSSIVLDTEEKISRVGLESSAAKVFPKGTVVIAMYCAMPDISMLGLNAATNQACCAFKPKRSYMNAPYIYYLIKYAQPHMIAFAHGAAQQNLSQELIKRFSVLVADERLIIKFGELALPLFQTIETLMRSNDVLVKTRDLLVPRLISGKLSVEDLELPSNENLTAVSSSLPQQELAHA